MVIQNFIFYKISKTSGRWYSWTFLTTFKNCLNFGVIIASVTLVLSIFFILSKFMFDINYPAGLTTIIVLVLFGISLNALFLGIIGEYLSRIYDQQKNRPITIIEERIND